MDYSAELDEGVKIRADLIKELLNTLVAYNERTTITTAEAMLAMGMAIGAMVKLNPTNA